MSTPLYPHIEKIYLEWNDALESKNIEAMKKLYAEDATLESPLVAHLLQSTSGILQGRDAIINLLETLFPCQPEKRHFYRDGYFTDGVKLFWEYPRLTPEGEQMDFAEIMEIKNNLIQSHRVYWGWYGVNVLKNNEHFSGK
jgi:hypothetical protein